MTILSLTKHKRLGHYRAGSKIFFNKIDAVYYATEQLKERNDHSVYWEFNKDIFSKFDWKDPIKQSLSELYYCRAKQLRDKYDYLSLFYSGGVDSTNILRAFVDNGIFLDEIVMYRPVVLEPSFNKESTKTDNVYSEIKFAAIPYAEKYADKRTSIRVLDMCDPVEKFLTNEELIKQYWGINKWFSPNSIAKTAIGIFDPHWYSLYESGKTVGHIHGAEKPNMEITDNDEYYFHFYDWLSHVVSPSFDTDRSLIIENHQFIEPFYWTPDVPELVIKQCQTIKEACQDPAVKQVFKTHQKLDAGANRRKFTNSALYSPDILAVREMFNAEKHGLGLHAPQMDWFYKYMSKPVLDRFWGIVTDIRREVDGRFFMTTLPSGPVLVMNTGDAPTKKWMFRHATSDPYFL